MKLKIIKTQIKETQFESLNPILIELKNLDYRHEKAKETNLKLTTGGRERESLREALRGLKKCA